MEYCVEELSGDQLPDLATAQALARSALALDLAATICELLEMGILAQVGGYIVPAKRK